MTSREQSAYAAGKLAAHVGDKCRFKDPLLVRAWNEGHAAQMLSAPPDLTPEQEANRQQAAAFIADWLKKHA